ncbi:hypothetical protein O181_053304 [Austropuccinia psidii MF-1]|uniref:Reverse transcriptase domain-containing protein n=1 Tax=Austropuccinia psidii MF-1 TaxID=1389203 RepID=A0A9Q3E2E5_9BASI|nr:hypothetical protein [Austropuccinia psidii MF-1]
MYGIDIYNSKNRHITIGTNKEKENSLDKNKISAQDPLGEQSNEFRGGKLSITLTSKQKLRLLKMLRKNRPAFAIGEELLCKIRGHDIELYLNVGRPYPPMLRSPPSPGRNLKHISMNSWKVGITTPVLITWHDGKSRLCADSRALKNYTKAYRYPLPRIPHALDKQAKARYITKMDCMKGFHQYGFKPHSMKLLRIICDMSIYEYTRMPFDFKNAPAHFQRMMDTIFQEEILEGLMVAYIDYIIIYSETWEDHLQYINRVLSKSKPKNLRISLKQCNFCQQELLALGHKVSGLNLAIEHNKVEAVLHAACSQGLGAALHQRQVVDGEARDGVIFYISKDLKDSEASYVATQTECLSLVWALEKLHYYLEGAVFEV